MYLVKDILLDCDTVFAPCMITNEVPNILWATAALLIIRSIFRCAKDLVQVVLNALLDIMHRESSLIIFAQEYQTILDQFLCCSSDDFGHSNLSGVIKSCIRADLAEEPQRQPSAVHHLLELVRVQWIFINVVQVVDQAGEAFVLQGLTGSHDLLLIFSNIMSYLLIHLVWGEDEGVWIEWYLLVLRFIVLLASLDVKPEWYSLTLRQLLQL